MLDDSEYQDYEACTKYGDKDESDNWEDYEIAPPPPPPKEYHEAYGIEYNHGGLEALLKAAQDGDKIYVPPGTYSFCCDDFLDIKSSVEIIGMGQKPEDTVLYRNRRIDIEAKGPVRFTNLTLRCGTRYDKWNMSKPDDGPMLYLWASNRKDGNQTDLVLDNCIIDMGMEEEERKEMEIAKRNNNSETPVVQRHPGFVSGLFVQEAKSVTINRCHFKGGVGSAIVITNDPALIPPEVEILNSSFSDCGQQLNAENNKGLARNIKKVPAPGAIELWSIQRNKKNAIQQRPFRLAGVSFQSNRNAPIAARHLSEKDSYYSWNKKPEVKLVEPDREQTEPDGVQHLPTESFNVSLFQSTLDFNGSLVDCAKFGGKSFPGNEASILLIENENYPGYCTDGCEETRWGLIYQPRE